MAHKFQGLWRSMIMPDVSPSATPEPRPDGQMFVLINEGSGVVVSGSTHDGKPLTGHTEPDPNQNKERLTIIQEEATNIRVHVGHLVTEVDSTGQRSLVIMGRYKDTAKIQPGGVAVTAQNEGVWVVTKP